MRAIKPTLKENLKDLWEKKFFVIGLAVIYAVNALIQGNVTLFGGHGELRVFIFIPALAALWFGGPIGALTAGLGTLLLDIINNVIINGEPLDLGNLISFLGNVMGAFFVGMAGESLDVDAETNIVKDKFTSVVWNTIVSVLGMGIFLGSFIGLGLFAVGVVPTVELGLGIAGSIVFWNSLFIVVAMIPIQLLVLFWERRRARKRLEVIKASSTFKVMAKPDKSLLEISQVEVLGEDGLVNDDHEILRLTLKNKLPVNMSWRIEVNAEDQIDLIEVDDLAPEQEVKKDVSIYLFDDGVKTVTFYPKPKTKLDDAMKYYDPTNPPCYKFAYKVLPEPGESFRIFGSFILVLTLLSAVIGALKLFFGQVPVDIWNDYFFVFLIIIVEMIVLTLVFYIIRNYRLQEIERLEAKV